MSRKAEGQSGDKAGEWMFVTQDIYSTVISSGFAIIISEILQMKY